MKKTIVSLLCTFSILLGCVSGLFPFISFVANADENSVFIKESEIPMRLWYNQEAKITNTENSPYANSSGGADEAWEQQSLPIGNGYFGANIFGRTEIERVQISEKTLSNPFSFNPNNGGLNNFSETYIDFGHTNNKVENYLRYLDLDTAIAGVEYTYDNVKYTREYFTSYPDKALVIKLDADTDGALSFTLRPTVPYEQDYMTFEDDALSKKGTVTSSVTKGGIGYIELSGKMGYYDVDFLGIYKVYTNGGTVTASTTEHSYVDTAGVSHTDKDGTIVVNGAKSAYIVVTLGTDYELKSEMFASAANAKPTKETTIEDTRNKVGGYMSAIETKISQKSFEEAYNTLKNSHIADHNEIFSRVDLNLGATESDLSLTTDKLLEEYKKGNTSTYLEALMFQYGRYLLIASSRSGALPANLQGVWNTYNIAPWGSGYWHNINVQMNYWPAFSTNIAETFEAYVEYNNAYMEEAEKYATQNVSKYSPELLNKDGGNGWVIGTGHHQYDLSSDRSAGHLGFTTQMFWDYYQFTKDPEILQHVYDVLVNAARYITKCVELDADGNYLVSYCDSPEVFVNGKWYYTVGTTYAQTFAYLNNYNAICAAKDLGIDLNDTELLSTEEYSILKTVLEQIEKYDPIHVGLSGQIKEFREEDYYGSVGDEPGHRHTSQLVGLYPGNIINGTTEAWLDAAKVTLEKRQGGNSTGGWVYAHKSGLYARTKDGDMAHEMVKGLITDCALPNLFTRIWKVYQIDASLGITAGIAEMLLQSHEGYIEPLAALPKAWTTGSYTGLVARGNFEVSATWENGLAKTINVKSKNGDVAKVYYPSITNAKVVKASDNTAVSYTVSGKNLITFDTEIGETYLISGFTAVNKLGAPTVLNYSRVNTFGDFNLVWSPVENAVSYNVYVAVENAPKYTIIENTTNTTAQYTPENDNARITFAVTAVSSDETESDRTLCYSNPIDTVATIEKIKGNVLESGELQIIVKANSNTIGYKLYEKNSNDSEYNFVYETKVPVLCTKYDKNKEYAVSIISYYQCEESELVEVSYISTSGAKASENVFKGKTFVPSSDSRTTVIQGYEYSKITDGIIDIADHTNGRFSSKYNGATATTENPNPTPRVVVDATLDLESNYILTELRFYLYNKTIAQIGTNLTLEIYSEGEWVTVVKNLTNDEIKSNYLKVNGTGKADTWLVLDLNGIKGSKVRIYVEPLPGNYVTFYEAECYGTLIEEIEVSEQNIFEGKEFIGKEPTIVSPNAGGDVFKYDRLTDGIISTDWKVGRYSSKIDGKLNGELDLGEIYLLNEIRAYVYENKIANAGQNWKIEVYFNGEWKTAKTIATNAELEALVESGNEPAPADKWISIKLDEIAAEKIRITADALSGGCLTFYEIRGFASTLTSYGVYSDNLLSGKEFISNEPTIVSPNAGGDVFKYDRLTDGIISADWKVGRYSSNINGKFDGLLEFDGIYLLENLKIYVYEKKIINAGQNWKIEVYFNGEWKTAKTIATNAELEALVESGNEPAPADKWISIKLDGIAAEKIRITADALSGGCLTFYEIRCTGYELNSASVDRSSMINVYEKLANLNISNEHHNEKLELFRNYLTDFKLTEKNAELYTAEMQSYYQTVLKDLTAQITFVPKTSIILGDCLSLNLYVPVDTLVKFTFNGTVYEDLDALKDKKVTLNGKEYYLISVPIAAAEGAKEFKLIATIAAGDNTLTGTFTVSIPKYAKIVLAGSSEVEKQIVRDVLSYIRAAYNYFDADNTDAISQIDSIIGARYDETAPYTPEGSTAVPSVGLSYATFALNSTPALKFYIDGSAPADAYEFFINGKRIDAKVGTDGDRTYILLDVFAYAMCETVTYTINGEKAGSYHIAAYHEWAKTQNDEALVKLVERFWKYCQSARDYKNSVVPE